MEWRFGYCFSSWDLLFLFGLPLIFSSVFVRKEFLTKKKNRKIAFFLEKSRTRLFYNNASSSLILFVFVLHSGVSFGQWLPTVPSMEQIFGISSGTKSKEPNTPKISVNINLSTGLVTLQQVNLHFSYFEGADGRVVAYPSHWRRSAGDDGRIVAAPYDWLWTEGNDGRKVPYPSVGWSIEQGEDGRKVIRPYSGWTTEKGGDGRRVVRPFSNWTYETGADGRRAVRPYSGWTWEEGRDGRRVVRPNNWTWEQGNDGRKVVKPFNWTWTQGVDGRKIIYPSTEWTWTQSQDGRKVALPNAGWTWEQGRDGRRVVRPNGYSGTLELTFVNAEHLALFEALRKDLSEKELIHYILYIWINLDKED